MTPQENFDFLNEYLGWVSPRIREHGGFIDKYIGDAVMAIFPGTSDDGVAAAIEMARGVATFSDELEASGRPRITTGAGLHTGDLMLGIIGAEDRFDATVIADAVNLASRLESLTKIYGASVLISEATLNGMYGADDYQHRFLGIVQVKGKELPVKVFEVFDADPEPVREKKAETNEGFQEGLDLYFEKRFAEAAVKFSAAKDASPDDKAFQLYLKRAAYFLGQGAPEDWTGVEMMSEK
jgi:two-component system sensor histidine kinase ChiS